MNAIKVMANNRALMKTHRKSFKEIREVYKRNLEAEGISSKKATQQQLRKIRKQLKLDRQERNKKLIITLLIISVALIGIGWLVNSFLFPYLADSSIFKR